MWRQAVVEFQKKRRSYKRSVQAGMQGDEGMDGGLG